MFQEYPFSVLRCLWPDELGGYLKKILFAGNIGRTDGTYECYDKRYDKERSTEHKMYITEAVHQVIYLPDDKREGPAA